MLAVDVIDVTVLGMISAVVSTYMMRLKCQSITKKVSPALLFKKAWPTFLICLTTASSAAAFGTNTRDAAEKFGIDKKLVEFGIPIGQVVLSHVGETVMEIFDTTGFSDILTIETETEEV